LYADFPLILMYRRTSSNEQKDNTPNHLPHAISQHVPRGKSQSGRTRFDMPARPLVYAISLITWFGVVTDKKLQIHQAIWVTCSLSLRFYLGCAPSPNGMQVELITIYHRTKRPPPPPKLKGSLPLELEAAVAAAPPPEAAAAAVPAS